MTSNTLYTNWAGSLRLAFEWSLSGNTVSWKLKGNYSGSGTHRTVWQRNVIINGETVHSSNTNTDTYEGTILASGTFTVSSSFRVSVNAGIGQESINATLPNQPVTQNCDVYATISASVASRSFNSVRINWSTDANVDEFQYKLGNGNWIYAETNIDKRSGSFTIPNLAPDTAYKISFDARRKDSQQWSTWGNKGTSVNTTTYDIGKISSVQGFNHGDNANLTITNPSGAILSLEMKIENTQVLTKSVVAGENTIDFTENQLDSIYRLYSSSNTLSAAFILTTGNYTDTKTATITLTGNQKTGHKKINNEWKRSKRWLKVNGEWKRCVRWSNINGNWKRCI